jgi:hypothetical protein
MDFITSYNVSRHLTHGFQLISGVASHSDLGVQKAGGLADDVAQADPVAYMLFAFLMLTRQLE